MTRRLFQIHLLTAVVGMLSLGVFVGMNLTASHVELVKIETMDDERTVLLYSTRCSYRGWPQPIYDPAMPDVIESKSQVIDGLFLYSDKNDFHVYLASNVNVPLETAKRLRSTSRFLDAPVLTVQDIREQEPSIEKCIIGRGPVDLPLPAWETALSYCWKSIAVNASVCLGMTLAIVIGIEWYLRRRERTKV